MTFVAGAQSTFDNTDNTILLDLKDSLDFLRTRQDGIALLKRIGVDGFTFANHKIEWKETELAPRKETITLADGTTTTLTVADAYQYLVNTILKCENEEMRVTAIASATTLTVVRGYAGTTAAAHSAKTMFSLGTAMPEGSNASEGLSNKGTWLYNYDQTFERTVALTNDEIAQLSVEGNPLPYQLKMRTIEAWRELFQALMYGTRYKDTSNEIYKLGGLKQFVTTNVTNVAGAASVTNIDAIIKAIVDAGGDPKVIAVGTYQKQKLDALDANLVRTGKREDVGGSTLRGGNPVIQTWQSGILDHPIDIVVDHTILDSELWILDTDYIEIGHKSHHGVNGAFHVEDSTPNGADRQERVIRGKYSARFRQQKSHGYLYGLT